MDDNSVFPVKSPTACLLKWGWSTLFLYRGDTNSCHRTTLSRVTAESFESFHNTPEKLEQREIMRRGGWPARGNGCEYCKDIEDAGGMSDRTTNLKLLAIDEEQRKLIPRELLDNPDALSVTPTMLEVYFTNRCNMSCIYCGPDYSTQWVKENKRFGQQPHHSSSINWQTAKQIDQEYPERLRKFWVWLEKNYRALRMFHVLGGEPFYQRETVETIKFWYDHPNPDLHLKIFSNLKVEKKRFRSLVRQLKRLSDENKCRSVGIIASLDSWGPEQEYVRTGLDLENWSENYEHLIYDNTWANVSINSTINALSVRTMPELLRRLKDWEHERSRRNGFNGNGPGLSLVFNRLLGPNFMNAGIFPEGFFDAAFEEIVNLLPARDAREKANREYMRGIWSSVNAVPHDPVLIRSLKSYLDEMDRRRGTDWRSTFEWLTQVG